MTVLNRCENEVMRAVYCLCDGTDGCLISPFDIISALPGGKKYTAERVDDALIALQTDGYLSVISSERKGEKMYVISLKESGMNFKTDALKRRKEVTYKIGLALIGAIATFVFGLILKAIFKVQ